MKLFSKKTLFIFEVVFGIIIFGIVIYGGALK